MRPLSRQCQPIKGRVLRLSNVTDYVCETLRNYLIIARRTLFWNVIHFSCVHNVHVRQGFLQHNFNTCH